MKTCTVGRIVTQLQKEVNWHRFANMVSAIGCQFNDAQKRFLKGELIEKALEECSNQILQYVGQSQDGCDFIMRRLHRARIEMKFDAGALVTPRGKLRRTIRVKLMNSHGSNTHTALPKNYADFLIVASMRGVVMIPKSIFKKYIISHGDGVIAEIPSRLATIIVGPDVMQVSYKSNFMFGDELNKLTKKFLKSIK